MKRAGALLALPGMAWLAAFFLVAFYAIVAVGFGNITDVYEPVPHWNPNSHGFCPWAMSMAAAAMSRTWARACLF